MSTPSNRTEPTPTTTATAAAAVPLPASPPPTASTAAAAAAAATTTDSQFKVYKPPKIAARQPEELPDGYFTPTLGDLKARQQDLHARAVAVNNAPLLTRAQREAQAKMKRDRWPNVRTLRTL